MTWVMAAVNLQWTTMGLLSVPHCTLYTSSTTAMMVWGLENLPWEVQLCIWNWVTKWVLPNYKCKQKSSWAGHMRNCLQDLVCTWSTIDTSLLTKPSYSLDTRSVIESSPQGIVNPSLGQYWQHTSYCENRQLLYFLMCGCVVSTDLLIFLERTQHHNHPAVYINYQLPELSNTPLHGALSHNECILVSVALEWEKLAVHNAFTDVERLCRQ